MPFSIKGIKMSELSEKVKRLKIGMSEKDVFQYMSKPRQIKHHNGVKAVNTEQDKNDERAKSAVFFKPSGSVKNENKQVINTTRALWSDKEGLDVWVTFENGIVSSINTDYCEDWKNEVLDGFNVNENFLKAGEVIEVGMLTTDPQTGRQATNRQTIYLESVEVIGGSVFLGLRHFKNLYLNEDETEIVDMELYDTVQYHNINLYVFVQRFGQRKKIDIEIKKRNDELLKEEQALQTQQEVGHEPDGSNSGAELP